MKKRSDFITGPTGRAIRSLPARGAAKDALLVADYLIIAPTANAFGLYQLDVESIVLHLPVTTAEARAALTTLGELEYAFYDEASRWIWVKEMAHYQLDTPLKPQDNIIKSVKRWYATCQKNPWLGPFYDRYHADLCLDFAGERSGPPVDRRDYGQKPLPRGSEAPPKGGSNLISSPTEVVEGGVGGGGGEFALVPANGRVERRRKQDARAELGWKDLAFQEFWNLYPRRKERKDAWHAWVEKVKTPEDAQVVLEGLRRNLPYFNYAEEGRFIVYPSRWLIRERWKDEPPTMPAMSQKTEATAKAVLRAGRRGPPQ